MAEQTLLLVEATGIQEYIFGSNELVQNIGASELVRQATEEWVKSSTKPEQCIYVGGGNAMLLFESDAQANSFARKLTLRALKEAPGLQIIVAQKSFPNGNLVICHQDLRKIIAQRKLDRQPSVPLIGLGVTAACMYTGMPAVEEDEGKLISSEVQKKRGARESGNEQLARQLPEVKSRKYDFMYNFNEMGTSGESSYLAVIHTDGNNMGARIQALGAQCSNDDEAYIKALKAFSESVKNAAQEALSSTTRLLLNSIDQKTDKINDSIFIVDRKLPFRPIVFGGDDVTFVCDGRLGLPLAAHYLSIFSAQQLSDRQPAHARAGVAVVKSHYPFSRAYDLAEDLAASAKSYIKQKSTSGSLTALDWHFAVNGLVLPLREVREREYTVRDGSLLMRPVQITPDSGEWRTWDAFVSLINEFKDENKQWAGQRNKIKALRQTLREGRQAVPHFMQSYRGLKKLPEIKNAPSMAEQGWQGKQCGYFDAIEALDFYVKLQEDR